jgi:PAS domain-containing protein
MRQEPIELILLKHWASYVAVPIWVTDVDGNLIYYNEPAEPILGRRFDVAGEIPADRISQLFFTSDPDGRPVPNSELPLVVALTDHVPSHRVMRIEALDGSTRLIEVTALPIIGQAGRHLGAMATFWETP